MHAAPRKLCLLGPGDAGKTTLALRLAGRDAPPSGGTGWHVLALPPQAAADGPLLLFDAPGHSTLDALGQAMLQHAGGWLLVARADDAHASSALPQLHRAATRLAGERPALVVLTQSDRGAPPAATKDALAGLGPVHVVSAHTGTGMDALRSALAQLPHPLPAGAA